MSVFGEVISDAFALAIVGYAISISLGKTFALKHGYKVDSNQVNQNLHKYPVNSANTIFSSCMSVYLYIFCSL